MALFAEQHDKAAPSVVALTTLYRDTTGAESRAAHDPAVLLGLWPPLRRDLLRHAIPAVIGSRVAK
jgi:hypothetical protein